MAIRFDFPSTAPKLPVTRRGDEAASRNTQTIAATADPKSAARLTLGAALKKAGETARAFGDSLTTRFDEARKSSAREQVAQIRERIQMLKRLILLFGGSKTLLRELKQLAGALAAAADVLKEGGGGGSASTGLEQGLYTEVGVPASGAPPATQADDSSPGSEAAESSDEQREAEALVAQAESELAALGAKADPQDPTASDDAPPLAAVPSDGQQAQRRADAELLGKAVRELKALLALAKSAQRKADRDDQKRIKDIEEQVEQVEQAIGELNAPTSLLSGFAGISVRA